MHRAPISTVVSIIRHPARWLALHGPHPQPPPLRSQAAPHLAALLAHWRVLARLSPPRRRWRSAGAEVWRAAPPRTQTELFSGVVGTPVLADHEAGGILLRRERDDLVVHQIGAQSRCLHLLPGETDTPLGRVAFVRQHRPDSARCTDNMRKLIETLGEAVECRGPEEHGVEATAGGRLRERHAGRALSRQ